MEGKIAGFEVAFLIIGIVQTVKQLIEGDPNSPDYKPLKYRATQLLSLGVSVIVLVLAALVNGGYLSPGGTQVIEEIVRIIGYMLAVPGLYSVGSDKILRAFRR
jgi:hypothetical protein